MKPKTQTQRLTDLELQITEVRAENVNLRQEIADLKNVQRMLAAAIRELNAPSPAFIASVGKSRQ